MKPMIEFLEAAKKKAPEAKKRGLRRNRGKYLKIARLIFVPEAALQAP
jgi:hypothetical protein